MQKPAFFFASAEANNLLRRGLTFASAEAKLLLRPNPKWIPEPAAAERARGDRRSGGAEGAEALEPSKGAEREPKREARGSREGAKREPRGSQDGAKKEPRGSRGREPFQNVQKTWFSGRSKNLVTPCISHAG